MPENLHGNEIITIFVMSKGKRTLTDCLTQKSSNDRRRKTKNSLSSSKGRGNKKILK